MLRIELDIFSGRPNPSWILSPKEEKELVDRVKADPSLMLPVTAATGGLGYRGYIVTTEKEGDESLGKAALPSRFRLGGEPLNKDAATALWLLDTSEKPDTEVDDFLRGVATDTIVRQPARPERPGQEGVEKGSLAACASNYFTSSTNFSFWNGSSYISNNNCYNFAANHRTNTFAQPGRISGHLYSSLTCSSVSTAAQWDGWFNGCQSADNLTIALVTWPGVDFHFYRKCASGIWCHKPGSTAARNYDNSGNIITNVETCNRGGYTSFCGYWYANNSLIMVQ
ncbi:MAG TPA: hypothetical protein VMW27_15130 [Thermoanaerobaculia bacterium]|nr:hypothetical protein [Thermoanaerobaculia bacterium]